MIRILSNGGGTNSAAIIVGMWERGERFDYNIFADTGDEKPHTYEFISIMSDWCVKHGLPPITTIKGKQPQMAADGSLSIECLRLGSMPSKVYGFGSCSIKWKQDPQKAWRKALSAQMGVPLSEFECLIGFDADEEPRVQRALTHAHKMPEKQSFPLYAWGWGREECIEAIRRAGLPQPGKSSCFYCPSSKKWEILELRDKYPELLDIALNIEYRAVQGLGQAPAAHVPGLGRTFNWAHFLSLNPQEQAKFSDAGTPEMDCGCID